MAEVPQLTEVPKDLMAVLQGVGGGGVGGAGGERLGRREEENAKQKLLGKNFEMFKVFSGGEAEWHIMEHHQLCVCFSVQAPIDTFLEYK